MDIRQPKPAKRGCYRPYDPEQISRAVNAVYMDKISVRKAAQQFNIPKSTLIDRVSGRTDIDCVKSGVTPIFTEEQEALLKNHLVTMAEVGYGYSRQETINLASDYAIHLDLRDLEHPLTGRWLQGFLERFPELKVKKPRSLEIARAYSATRPAIDNYFKELDRIMGKYNLHDRPHSVFNIDEKGLSLEHKPPKIVAGKHYKAQAVTAGRSKTVTLIGCVSGVGQQIPSFFIFPGARMISELMEGASPGAVGTVTPSGWSNTAVFEDYMKNHLNKYLPSKSTNSPILVLYDGHKSHVSLSLIEWAKTEHIILFVLPPHCSHLLQPLDVSCFGPFEISWNAACHKYIRESGGQMVTRNEACKIACKVYSSTLTVPNIQAAFRRCGIIPFNSDIVQDHQVAPSLSFPKSSLSSTTKEPATEDAVKFLEEKGGKILENVAVAKKPRNTLSKVIAGKAITEDDVISKIKEHSNKYKPKTKQIPNKCVSPKPSTSGISSSKPTKKPRKSLVLAESISDSSDDEVPDSERCIVCKRVEPDTSKNPYVLLINWGKCDKCNGWVHLAFCSTIRVLRRGDSFLCPNCSHL